MFKPRAMFRSPPGGAGDASRPHRARSTASSGCPEQRPDQRMSAVARPVPRSHATAGELTGSIDQDKGRRASGPIGGRGLTIDVEQDPNAERVLLQPRRDALWGLPNADGPDHQPLAFELSMKNLDLRGQLPRADRTPGGPEVEKRHVPLEIGQGLAPPIETDEPEGGRIAPPGAHGERAKQRIEVSGRD